MKNLILFILFLALISCESETITIPDTGRKITINGLIGTDSLLGVNLSSSLKIDNSTDLFDNSNYIKDAIVKIYQNGDYIDSLNYSYLHGSQYNSIILGNNYHSKKQFPMAGKEYKIVVSANGKQLATATTTIPNMVKIERIDTTRTQVTNVEEWESTLKMACDIVFTDPADEKNYYLLQVYQSLNNSLPNITYGDFSFEDPIIEENLKHGGELFGGAFSDKAINGKQHRLRILVDGGLFTFPQESPFFTPTTKMGIHFKLYSITEEYYKYIQTLNLFFKNYDDPLAQHTQVYSNINGGYGIFAGAAVSSDSIIFRR